jgi:DNA-binding transcriptional MocR family regulator
LHIDTSSSIVSTRTDTDRIKIDQNSLRRQLPGTRPPSLLRLLPPIGLQIIPRLNLQTDKPLAYSQLAELLSTQIAAHTYLPGDRLPSVRELALRHRYSMETVLRAFRLLEDRGLVEPRPRSGFFVRHKDIRSLPAPSTPATVLHATNVDLSALRHQTILFGTATDFVPLSLTLPSPEILPTRKLVQTITSVARRFPAEIVQQGEPAGSIKLRQQLARRASKSGCFLTPDDFVVTVGASEAINLALRAICDPGDIVLVESPSYFGTLEIIESLKLRVVELATDPEQGISVQDVAKALNRFPRVRACLLVTNHSNPLGCTLSPETKEQLVHLLAKRDVVLIEDDVFGDLYQPNQKRPVVAKAFDTTGSVILVNSFSKVLAPGFRLGWIAPGRYRDRILQLKSSGSLATPSLTQLAVADFLKSGSLDRHLHRMRAFLAEQLYRFTNAVIESFPPATRISRPSGGFVLWIEVPCDTLELAKQALTRYRIAIAPGKIFSARGDRYGNCFRLSCGYQFSLRFAEAVTTLGKLAGMRSDR